ncbi:MAG: peptidase M14, partial [Planctomycetes bacterium]|nr:peptidase M14 [Planctomycetota bacterium]
MAFRTQPHLTAFSLCLCLLTLGDSARANRLPAADSRLPVSDLQADPAIPTIRAALGYDWATAITSHAQMERYLQELVKSAPDRTLLVRYGTSYEGRGLYYLAVTSAENRRRLEEIRTANQRLADPRLADADEARRLVAELPALVWLAASVHGNELSCTEAALLAAYHLLADTRPETQAMLEKLVVLIDPLQNPDGRERYVNVYRESRGRFPNANPLSTEHAERWPGGRFNHYLFDMNRDWFLQSQQETVHKVRAYLKWQPQLYVDMHEMGHNSTYFFVPPADPINPFVLHSQMEWLWDLGRQQAEWFDRRGFSYTTREMFDAFYPGYGSKWPLLQGGIGVLWEQAGTRGLLV